MKRPFLHLSTGFLAGILFSFCVESVSLLFGILTLFFAFFLLCLLRTRSKWHRGYPFFGAAFLGICFVWLTVLLPAKPILQARADLEMPVRFTVAEQLPDSGGVKRYRVELQQINGQDTKGCVTLYANEELPLFAKGEARIRFFEKTTLFESLSAGKGCLRSASLYPSNENPLILTPPDQSSLPAEWRQNLHKKVNVAIERAFGADWQGIVLGLTTGETSHLSADDLFLFRQAGIAHLFAVSGLHLSILVGVFLSLLRRSRARSGFSLLLLPLIFGIMLLADFSPSVLRAGVMLCFCILAGLFHRAYDPVRALGITVLLLLMINPTLAATPGFLLSVAASGGILLLSPRLSHRLERYFKPKTKIGKDLTAGLCVATGAYLAVFPISLFFFDGFSLIAPLTNLVASPFMPFAIIFANAALFLQLLGVPSFLVAFPVGICKGFLWVLRWISRLFASLPLATMQESRLPLQIGVAGLAILLLLLCHIRPSFQKVGCVFLAGALLLTAYNGIDQLNRRKTDSVLVQMQENDLQICAVSNGNSFLFATSLPSSARSKINELLNRRNINHLDAAVVIKQNAKTTVSLSQLADRHPIDRLMTDGQAPTKAAEIFPLSDGEIRLSGRMSAQIFEIGGSFACCLTSGETAFLFICKDSSIPDLLEKDMPSEVDYCFYGGTDETDLIDLSCKKIFLAPGKSEVLRKNFEFKSTERSKTDGTD